MCVREPAMSGGIVHCALLTTNYIVVNISCGKSHASHCHRFGFIVPQFHGLL